jgi:hypothetical protein
VSERTTITLSEVQADALRRLAFDLGYKAPNLRGQGSVSGLLGALGDAYQEVPALVQRHLYAVLHPSRHPSGTFDPRVMAVRPQAPEPTSDPAYDAYRRWSGAIIETMVAYSQANAGVVDWPVAEAAEAEEWAAWQALCGL